VNEREVAAGLAETPGYRYADEVGDQLFVAGQVPHDSAGSLVGVDEPAEQAAACLANLRALVGAHGFAMSDVRHLTIHVVGEHDQLGAAWSAVRTWFDDDVPPATLLGAHSLGHPGQLVEIDAVVVRSHGSDRAGAP
jgi:enamine deaminase RidA (YjgF/YER057c/UK114 family)